MVSRDDIRKLAGGYATGTLTENERKLLFEAALEDQELFDELAREQSLKSLLDEPGAKQRLIASLAPAQNGPHAIPRWRWAAVFGALAATIAVAWMLRPVQPAVQIAQIENPPAIATPAPEEPKPAPAPAPYRAPAARQEKPSSNVIPKDRELDKMVDSVPAPLAPAPPLPSQEKPSQEKLKAADEAGRSSIEPKQRKAEVQVQAQPAQMQPAPLRDSQTQQSTISGFRLGAGPPPHFSLDYSLEDQVLVIKFAADGYFSMHFSPGLDTIVDAPVTAGSSRREHIPNNATEALIVFSAAPQATSGGVSVTRENKIGSFEDPSRRRIELLLKFYP